MSGADRRALYNHARAIGEASLAHTMVEKDRRKHPVRYFGSWLGFTYDDGVWRAEYKGVEFYIEKRSNEGYGSGWFLFGINNDNGVWAGDSAVAAADYACSLLRCHDSSGRDVPIARR